LSRKGLEDLLSRLALRRVEIIKFIRQTNTGGDEGYCIYRLTGDLDKKIELVLDLLIRD